MRRLALSPGRRSDRDERAGCDSQELDLLVSAEEVDALVRGRCLEEGPVEIAREFVDGMGRRVARHAEVGFMSAPRAPEVENILLRT
jgi:hypothetical protein